MKREYTIPRLTTYRKEHRQDVPFVLAGGPFDGERGWTNELHCHEWMKFIQPAAQAVIEAMGNELDDEQYTEMHWRAPKAHYCWDREETPHGRLVYRYQEDDDE